MPRFVSSVAQLTAKSESISSEQDIKTFVEMSIFLKTLYTISINL